MDSGHSREDKKEQKNQFKKSSHACLASAGVQISIFFSAVFTSGLNRLYWEQQALSKTYKTKSTIGSRSKKKKSDWLIRIRSAAWSLRNTQMEKEGNCHIHKHMGTRGRWKGCRVINLSAEISTPPPERRV